MTTLVETGHGSEFWLADASGVLTKLGEVIAVPIPSGAGELIMASHMDTTGFHDYINAPLRDGEEVELEMNWVPNSATDDLCLAAVGSSRDYKIILPVDDDTYEIEGTVLVRDYARNNPMDDRRTATLTIKWISDTLETFVPS
jgi:hypothetical protein